VAIFGAGSGLGLATANLFGQRGAKVALVARNVDRLNEHVGQLRSNGVAASAIAADIVDPSSFDEATTSIAANLGPIDVAVYQTAWTAPSVDSSLDITSDNERTYVERLLLAPIHAAHCLLAPMLARGNGSVVFTLGASALGPSPRMSQIGIPQAGLRNHLLTLATETVPRGVQVGVLTIGGLILGSNFHRTRIPDAGPDFPGALDPDDLARELNQLVELGAGPERIVGA
jgi:short-subunit dehydrogenase